MVRISLQQDDGIVYLICIENVNMDGIIHDRARITYDIAEATRFDKTDAMNIANRLRKIYRNPYITILEE